MPTHRDKERFNGRIAKFQRFSIGFALLSVVPNSTDDVLLRALVSPRRLHFKFCSPFSVFSFIDLPETFIHYHVSFTALAAVSFCFKPSPLTLFSAFLLAHLFSTHELIRFFHSTITST